MFLLLTRMLERRRIALGKSTFDKTFEEGPGSAAKNYFMVSC